MIIPLTENSTADSSMIRVSSTARSRSSLSRPVPSPRPGASAGTSTGASTNAIAAMTAVASSTRLSMELASRHAAAGPSRFITPV